MNTLEDQVHDLWEYVVRELPDNLDASAEETGALLRRKGVDSAANLLRIILTYGVTDLSLKAVSAWASSTAVGRLSPVALFYRIRDARAWLAHLIATLLQHEAQPLACPGLQIRLVDATVITGPGATGTEWRVHTGIDPTTGHLTSITLTDQHVGETYTQYPISAQDVLVGDRAYGLATGIAYVHEQGGYVVARANLQAIRLCRPDRTVFTPLRDAAAVPQTGVAHYDVLIPVPPAVRSRSHKTWKLEHARAWIPARLLAVRTVKNTILWVITTVPESLASDEVIWEVYRVRWQIELAFKRLKSLLGLDALPSKRGPTAQSWILARILAAILVEKFLRNSGVFSPWGYRLRPVAADRAAGRLPAACA